MDIERKIKEIKKGNNWCIRGDGQLAVEKVNYKKLIDYCEVIYLMGIKTITVEYLDEEKVYIFEYNYDLDDVLYLDEENY
jgi:hypothetical protein